MSDSVDDLHAAEDYAGGAANVIDELLRNMIAADVTLEFPQSLRDQAFSTLSEWRSWCRPTCGYVDEGECQSGEDSCGCPCNHEPKEDADGAPR